MDAFRTHGVVRADAIEDDVVDAQSTLAALQDQGISLDDITAQLVREGVQSFVVAFDTLFKSIADLHHV
jgi:transaldolase